MAILSEERARAHRAGVATASGALVAEAGDLCMVEVDSWAVMEATTAVMAVAVTSLKGMITTTPTLIDSIHQLVREIDTAFGLLPHGGAYNKSNFYDDYGNVIG